MKKTLPVLSVALVAAVSLAGCSSSSISAAGPSEQEVQAVASAEAAEAKALADKVVAAKALADKALADKKAADKLAAEAAATKAAEDAAKQKHYAATCAVALDILSAMPSQDRINNFQFAKSILVWLDYGRSFSGAGAQGGGQKDLVKVLARYDELEKPGIGYGFTFEKVNGLFDLGGLTGPAPKAEMLLSWANGKLSSCTPMTAPASDFDALEFSDGYSGD